MTGQEERCDSCGFFFKAARRRSSLIQGRRGLPELGLDRELFANEEGGRNWIARQSYSDEEGVSSERERERENGKESEKKYKNFIVKRI